ncbi:hypothetical protein L4174_007780 [Photobacterium sp. CCB-ST2H9]|uniref:hypothetical protein n=1 Tax=Photobacterium sp. CCB-ST2H9 TaxID=2912855 RepID=UPI002002B4D1|nr:hypothetical protein [Photobacterium sp. CCB-ST2H9]UTM58722.1 hypothetical protein L4174_007780 [Photobacterium sp. CCB-ST2H9]
MFKKKLSVVMLASLGLFGCGSDNDKKAVEENVTEEVVKPEGLNIQVDLYNKLPEDFHNAYVSFYFDTDNSGSIDENDFNIQVYFADRDPSITAEIRHPIRENNAPSKHDFIVERLGVVNVDSSNGKSTININIFPEPILADESVNGSLGLDSDGRPDPVLNEYLELFEKAKSATHFDTYVDYRGDSPADRSRDFLSDGGKVPLQLTSNIFSDSKDDYDGETNYADIERVSFSFN